MPRFCYVILLLLGLCACSADNTRTGGDFGTLSIELTPPQGTEAGQFNVTIAGAGGRNATWRYADVPARAKYLPGAYRVTATLGDGSEGVGVPFYTASADVALEAGQDVAVTLKPEPAHPRFTVAFSPQVVERFPGARATLHACGGAYVDYLPADTAQAWLREGDTQVLATLPYKDQLVTFQALEVPATKASSPVYQIEITLDGDRLTAQCPQAGASHTTTVDEAFLTAPAPTATAVGFEPGQTLSLPEGEVPASPLSVRVSSPTPLASVLLTVDSPVLAMAGIPESVDVLPSLTPNGGSVELDSLVARLVYLDAALARSSFSVVATDRAGRMSLPVTLRVDTREIEVTLTDMHPALVGAASATVTLVCNSRPDVANVEAETSVDGRTWHTSRILSIDGGPETGTYDVTFSIPPTDRDVQVRFMYCGEVRGQLTVQRVSPRFSIQVDAYANSALVKVVPDDASQLDALVKYLRVTANGAPLAVAQRLPEQGYVAVTGLSADTRYVFAATPLASGPSQASAEARTEKTYALPNGDFEEMDQDIDCVIPSGGRYSQNSVEIFNRQNRRGFKVETPQDWATTNAMTFYGGSSNRNTWYMQPSAIGVSDAKSGGRAVELVSVAHDPAGEAIPDYLQVSQPYLDYSPVVPNIRYRTAGRLFLGSLKYGGGAEGDFREGITFRSRPRSLNGFYKYVPCLAFQDDEGLATASVYGKDAAGNELLIGQGSKPLPIAFGYTAFSVEINYTKFAVKATRLCVEFRSSKVRVFTDDDPVTASSTGSRLYIDNISLAY